MEKYSLFGELLYIGFVCEKGRCKSTGFWKLGYKKNLYKHVSLLKQMVNCMLVNEVTNNDVLVLKKFIELIQNEKDIGKYYPIKEETLKHLQESNYSIINIVDISKKNNNINMLMYDITSEIIDLLSKGIIVNKKKVAMLLKAIHNLPRVYLGKGLKTICNIDQPLIGYKDALEYSFSNMDSDAKKRYKKYYQ